MADGRTTFAGLRPCQTVTIAEPGGGTNEVEFLRPERGGEVATVIDRDEDRRFTVTPGDIVAPVGDEGILYYCPHTDCDHEVRVTETGDMPSREGDTADNACIECDTPMVKRGEEGAWRDWAADHPEIELRSPEE